MISADMLKLKHLRLLSESLGCLGMSSTSLNSQAHQHGGFAVLSGTQQGFLVFVHLVQRAGEPGAESGIVDSLHKSDASWFMPPLYTSLPVARIAKVSKAAKSARVAPLIPENCCIAKNYLAKRRGTYYFSPPRASGGLGRGARHNIGPGRMGRFLSSFCNVQEETP